MECLCVKGKRGVGLHLSLDYLRNLSLFFFFFFFGLKFGVVTLKVSYCSSTKHPDVRQT